MVVVEVLVGVVAASLLAALGFSVRIVREYQRIVLFRLGRSVGIKGPGLVFINPVTDRTSLVDLRERFLEIPQQTAITQDNASISIDFIIFYKVVDPSMSVLEVQNFAVAAAERGGDHAAERRGGHASLDDVLSKREEMNASLRIRLDDVTERWGVKVTTVEVREVNPPAGVLEAMTRQMSAERTRRPGSPRRRGRRRRRSPWPRAPGRRRSSAPRENASRPSSGPRAWRPGSRDLVVGQGPRSTTMQLQYLETSEAGRHARPRRRSSSPWNWAGW